MTTAARWRGRQFLELFAASGFAVAQPILSVFGKSPDSFIFRRADRTDIVAFALLVAFAIPVVLWLLECVIARLSARTARVLHLVALTVFAGLLAIQVAARTFGARGVVLLVVAALVAGACIVAFVRFAAVRSFISLLAVAPVLFLLMFFVASPTADLLTSAATTAANRDPARGSSPSVVLVIFDEWPTSSVMDSAGAISSAFPHLRDLAATATWYRNSSSVSNATPYAVPAILTGSLPHAGLPTAANYPHNLFNAFGKKLRLDVSESVTSLCAAGCRSSSGPALASLVADARDTFGRVVSLDQTRRAPTTSFVETVTKFGDALGRRSVRFDQFLDGFRADEVPTLHVLHILLPHVPYRFLPSGVEYTAPPLDGVRSGDNWDTNPIQAESAHQRLLLQTGFVDRLIGDLTDRLRATGQFDSSVVAITADHGIAFRPGHGSRGLSADPIPAIDLPEMLDAPLIIKAPGQTQGVVSDANVMSIDVLPTLADLVKSRLPWPVEGTIAGQRTSKTKLFARESAEAGGAAILSPVRSYDSDASLHTLLTDDNVDSLTHDRTGRYRLFNPAGLGGLVGRRVSSIPSGASTSFRVTLDQAHVLRTGARSGATIPAMLYGLSDKPAVIAIALNGRVAATAPSAPLGTRWLFTAIAPDSLIRDRNVVRLYEVTGLPGNPVLHPIR